MAFEFRFPYALPNVGTFVGVIGWRMLANTPGLATNEARTGKQALEELQRQIDGAKTMSGDGVITIAKRRFAFARGETAEQVAARIHNQATWGPPVA